MSVVLSKIYCNIYAKYTVRPLQALFQPNRHKFQRIFRSTHKPKLTTLGNDVLHIPRHETC